MRVFLDDKREAPPGWVRCYWPGDVIDLLKTGDVKVVSLDHDLGDDQHGTGYDVLAYVEEALAVYGVLPPEIHIHTANPSARQRMEAAKASIEARVETGNFPATCGSGAPTCDQGILR